MKTTLRNRLLRFLLCLSLLPFALSCSSKEDEDFGPATVMEGRWKSTVFSYIHYDANGDIIKRYDRPEQKFTFKGSRVINDEGKSFHFAILEENGITIIDIEDAGSDDYRSILEFINPSTVTFTNELSPHESGYASVIDFSKKVERSVHFMELVRY